MEGFPSIKWFHKLQSLANKNKDFQSAARWFKGTIGWRIDADTYSLTMSRGQIEAIDQGDSKTLFIMSGSLTDWEELFARGTINRLFRQNRIVIGGDRIEAMRHWKVLWYLTEIARNI